MRTGTPPAKGGMGKQKRDPDGVSLKAFALKKLRRSIQTGKGHDSLEDAIAAKDLVHFTLHLSLK
jgi:hypothetical protein